MIKTFTLSLDITEKTKKEAKLPEVIQNTEPSAQTLQNILNFSKNLQILKLNHIHHVEVMKS